MPQPTTNNLEGWEERLEKIKIINTRDFTTSETDKEAMTKLLNDLLIPYKEVIKQFISDLRKKDREELIKRINNIDNNNTATYVDGERKHVVDEKDIKRLIQDYYK